MALNKAQIIGNLGADPDIKYGSNGTAVATLSVATTERWTDKQSGEKKEATEWHRVKVFGKQAESCGEYLQKGSMVDVEGQLRTSKYTDKEGVDRYSTDIVARNVQFLGGKTGGSKAEPAAPAANEDDVPF